MLAHVASAGECGDESVGPFVSRSLKAAFHQFITDSETLGDSESADDRADAEADGAKLGSAPDAASAVNGISESGAGEGTRESTGAGEGGADPHGSSPDGLWLRSCDRDIRGECDSPSVRAVARDVVRSGASFDTEPLRVWVLVREPAMPPASASGTTEPRCELREEVSRSAPLPVRPLRSLLPSDSSRTSLCACWRPGLKPAQMDGFLGGRGLGAGRGEASGREVDARVAAEGGPWGLSAWGVPIACRAESGCRSGDAAGAWLSAPTAAPEKLLT